MVNVQQAPAPAGQKQRRLQNQPFSQWFNLGQTHTKVHISISTNFGRFIANGLINQSLLRKRLTALALCKSGLCYS